MAYLLRLSKVQWGWLIGSLMIGAAIVSVGWILETSGNPKLPSFTTAMSIRDIAPKLGVTGKALAREFGLPLDVPKGKSLEKLGIAQDDLDHVTEHLIEHQSGLLKYYVFLALVLWGLVFLVRLGRPDGSLNAERKTWYPRWPYVVALVLAVAVCGFALGKSPNRWKPPSRSSSLALLIYRPFCQFICPFGLISWLAERFSLARIQIDPNRCNQCGACSRACPLDAAKDRVAGKFFAADCYSCARCLDVCPHEAISYRFVLSNRPQSDMETSQTSRK